MREEKFSIFGPSVFVAASFLAPTTLSLCVMAGRQSGYTILWALVFSVFSTYVLQEMASRLGWHKQMGLGAVLSQRFSSGISKFIAVLLVISALGFGSMVFAALDLKAAVLGLSGLGLSFGVLPLLLFGLAFLVLFLGTYQWSERVLVALFLIMAVSFLGAAILSEPHWKDVYQGMLPSQPSDEQDWLMLVAMTTATVLPINLFLHTALAAEKYTTETPLLHIRFENVIAIVLGGFVALAVVIVAAVSRYHITVPIETVAEMIPQMEPVLGKPVTFLFALGVFASGLTALITMPLAAAYAISGIFSLEKDTKGPYFRAVWMVVLSASLVLYYIDFPMFFQKFAELANALLLPVLAIFLLFISNHDYMGLQRNKPVQNVMAGMVILLSVLLVWKTI